ncbi:MAG: hypothetical protein JWM76_4125 [Pseudonocardiales bacterium]|nr:hypothetical protein [Pseudonocardiales bacterium]
MTIGIDASGPPTTRGKHEGQFSHPEPAAGESNQPRD